MSLNLKALLPLSHPEVTYPEKDVDGQAQCQNEEESIKSWNGNKLLFLKKKKKVEDKEASPLQKLNII